MVAWHLKYEQIFFSKIPCIEDTTLFCSPLLGLLLAISRFYYSVKCKILKLIKLEQKLLFQYAAGKYDLLKELFVKALKSFRDRRLLTHLTLSLLEGYNTWFCIRRLVRWSDLQVLYASQVTMTFKSLLETKINFVAHT